METVSTSEFKATCLALLDRVYETGEPLLITKHGKVVAQLVPPPVSERSGKWLGCGVGTGKILGDISGPAAEAEEWDVLRS
jgi:prevent-host-death family protein